MNEQLPPLEVVVRPKGLYFSTASVRFKHLLGAFAVNRFADDEPASFIPHRLLFDLSPGGTLHSSHVHSALKSFVKAL